MDSFIEWLVILFFIVSFLNSILKPKKTSQKETPAGSRDRVITSGPTVDIPDLRIDIEEALKQKKREIEKRKVLPETLFEKRYSEQRITENRLPEIRKKEGKKKAENLLDKIIAQPASAERAIPGVSLQSLNKALLDQESVRRSVLLAEILGKPKALKRKW